jgi:hypothetical protein
MDGRGDTETARPSNFGPVTIATPGDRQIVVTRVFDAPRGLVFEAWTKIEHVARWWDPSGVPVFPDVLLVSQKGGRVERTYAAA